MRRIRLTQVRKGKVVGSGKKPSGDQDKVAVGSSSRRRAFEVCLRRLGATKRETEVVWLVTLVYSNSEIASRLGISVAAIKRHLEHLFLKLRVGDRGQMAARVRAEMDEDSRD